MKEIEKKMKYCVQMWTFSLVYICFLQDLLSKLISFLMSVLKRAIYVYVKRMNISY